MTRKPEIPPLPVPDFSPAMLKAFITARIALAGFAATFPGPLASPRRPRLSHDEAARREKARIMKRADVSPEQMDLALSCGALGLAARLRLWRALGADPAAHGVTLLGARRQVPEPVDPLSAKKEKSP